MNIESILTAEPHCCLKENVSYEEYALIPAIRSGNIKSALFTAPDKSELISPLHLKADFEGSASKDSDAMAFGRALHCLLLEREEFPKRFCYYEGRRDERTKSYQEFLEENAGKEILKKSGDKSWDWCLEAAIAFCDNKAIQPYLSLGVREVTGLAVFDGIPVKVRFDWLSISEHAILDVKTTRSVGPLDFWYEFKRYGYAVQLALYQHVYKLITKKHWSVVVAAIENHPPFASVLYVVPDELLEYHLTIVRNVLAKVKDCLFTGKWPSFAGDEAVPLAIPEWEMGVDSFDWSE